MNITCVSAQGRELETDVPSLLSPAARESMRVDANHWIKQLRLVRYGTQTMRERFTYRGDSLWWFTELYLHKMKRLDRAIGVILALESAVARHQPARLVVKGGDAVDAVAAAAFGAAHNVPVSIDGASPRQRPGWQSFGIGLSAQLSRLRASATPPNTRPAIAAFVHSAFWHSPDPQGEGYIGPVLDALVRTAPDLFFVGVGPRRNFRARRWWDPVAPTIWTVAPITPIERLAPRERLRPSMALWRTRHDLARELTSGDAIRQAAQYRGCDLWPILQRELEDAARLQWPWSARAMDEAAAALDVLRPKAVLTYAEAGGWGRALMLEARRRHIASIGLQHGFIYRHWLNYLHEPDEMAEAGEDRGFPLPDRTLLYDEYAREHLRQSGQFPDAKLVVTGNARLDDLVARVQACRANRDGLRHGLGVSGDRRLALLTVKFVEMSYWLPAAIDAAASQPDIHLVIKPHPAETAAVYAPFIRGRANVTMSFPGLDLASLIAAADGIVTMNSTVALDALVMGVPSLVVGIPSNLSPFVDRGLMLGADGPEKIGQRLRALLYDRAVRDQLATAADPFIRHYGLAPDGHAAERAANEILRMTQ